MVMCRTQAIEKFASLLTFQEVFSCFGGSGKYNQTLLFQVGNITFCGLLRDLPLCRTVGSFTTLTTTKLLQKPLSSLIYRDSYRDIYRDIEQLPPRLGVRE